jgi:hypothetical protein
MHGHKVTHGTRIWCSGRSTSSRYIPSTGTLSELVCRMKSRPGDEIYQNSYRRRHCANNVIMLADCCARNIVWWYPFQQLAAYLISTSRQSDTMLDDMQRISLGLDARADRLSLMLSDSTSLATRPSKCNPRPIPGCSEVPATTSRRSGISVSR